MSKDLPSKEFIKPAILDLLRPEAEVLPARNLQIIDVSRQPAHFILADKFHRIYAQVSEESILEFEREFPNKDFTNLRGAIIYPAVCSFLQKDRQFILQVDKWRFIGICSVPPGGTIEINEDQQIQHSFKILEDVWNEPPPVTDADDADEISDHAYDLAEQMLAQHVVPGWDVIPEPSQASIQAGLPNATASATFGSPVSQNSPLSSQRGVKISSQEEVITAAQPRQTLAFEEEEAEAVEDEEAGEEEDEMDFPMTQAPFGDEEELNQASQASIASVPLDEQLHNLGLEVDADMLGSSVDADEKVSAPNEKEDEEILETQVPSPELDALDSREAAPAVPEYSPDLMGLLEQEQAPPVRTSPRKSKTKSSVKRRSLGLARKSNITLPPDSPVKAATNARQTRASKRREASRSATPSREERAARRSASRDRELVKSAEKKLPTKANKRAVAMKSAQKVTPKRNHTNTGMSSPSSNLQQQKLEAIQEVVGESQSQGDLVSSPEEGPTPEQKMSRVRGRDALEMITQDSPSPRKRAKHGSTPIQTKTTSFSSPSRSTRTYATSQKAISNYLAQENRPPTKADMASKFQRWIQQLM